LSRGAGGWGWWGFLGGEGVFEFVLCGKGTGVVGVVGIVSGGVYVWGE